MGIVKENYAEVKAKKGPKVISVKSLCAFIATVLISLAIGAWAGITISNAINDNISHQVDDIVNAQLKTSK